MGAVVVAVVVVVAVAVAVVVVVGWVAELTEDATLSFMTGVS